MVSADKRERYQLFVKLYEEYADRVLSYAVSLVKNRADAEEITQEAFVRAYRSLDRFDEARAKISTWIYTIARNLAYNHLRHKRYEADTSLYEKVKMGDEEIELLQLLPDAKEIGAEKMLELKELKEKVQNAIGLLPANYREVITLCDIHQLPREEVASLLRCSINAINIKLTRARKRLADIIKYP